MSELTPKMQRALALNAHRPSSERVLEAMRAWMQRRSREYATSAQVRLELRDGGAHVSGQWVAARLRELERDGKVRRCRLVRTYKTRSPKPAGYGWKLTGG